MNGYEVISRGYEQSLGFRVNPCRKRLISLSLCIPWAFPFALNGLWIMAILRSFFALNV